MIKIKLLFWTFAPLTMIGGATAPIIISTLNQEKIKDNKTRNESYIDRTKYIIDDINSLNNEDVLLKMKLFINEKFQKILRIIFEIDEYTLWNEYKYDINAKTSFDFNNKSVVAKTSAKINYRWFDKMSGYFGDWVKKRERNIELKIPEAEFKTNLYIKKDEIYADFFEYKFNNIETEYKQIKELDTSRWYLFYSVLNKTTFFSKFQIAEQTSYIVKNKIENIWNKFVENIMLKPSDNTYNLNTIKSKKFLKFNKHFSTLYELNKVSKIYDELNKKENKTINEKTFLKQLENYEFYSCENAEYKYNFLTKTGSLLQPNGDENFNIKVKELLNDLFPKINTKNYHFSYDNFRIIYYIIISYFATHNINIFANFNGENIKINLWKNKNFVNVFEQLPKDVQNDKNIQNINVYKIMDEKTYNCNVFYNEYSQKINKSYDFNYRWNALNKNPNVKVIKTNGVLLNINKYINEIINDNDFIDPKWLLTVLNKEIFNDDVVNDIKLLSDSNWNEFSNKFDINKFNKFFDLKSDDNNFNFNIDNSVGRFYAIIRINNFVFDDKTSGDYNKNFKNNLLKNINKCHNNILEIYEEKNDALFIIKMQTNKIHII